MRVCALLLTPPLNPISRIHQVGGEIKCEFIDDLSGAKRGKRGEVVENVLCLHLVHMHVRKLVDY